MFYQRSKIEKIIVLSAIVLLIIGVFTAGDIVYIDDNNMVVQVNDKHLIEARPLNRTDTSSIIRSIHTLE